MNEKTKFSFVILFVLLPIIFIISSISWRFFIVGKNFLAVIIDVFGILGIYYIFVSLLFSFVSIKKMNLRDIES
ncbi:hypothetical protein AB1L05_02685 [Cytobacillus horneckiae]|uniref:hypothetical protein n=1 Tax=Cytobacillus horneckiae TaxID=549687 RepID=UPI0039A22532